MRRGFTLIETLVIVIITPFVFLIFDGLFRTLLSDVPWSWRIAQENTTMLSMLDQLQQDIDTATALPESYDGLRAEDNLLLVESVDGVLCYQLEDGQVLRRRLTNSGESHASKERAWSLPHAKIVWQVRARNGQRYAVETSAHIERSVRGQWKKKMAHSRLYVVGAF